MELARASHPTIQNEKLFSVTHSSSYVKSSFDNFTALAGSDLIGIIGPIRYQLSYYIAPFIERGFRQ